MKRRLLILFLSLLLIVVLVLGWLLGTSHGNRTLLTHLPVEGLSIEQIEGSIWSDLSIGKIDFRSEAVDLSVADLRLSWLPKALFGRLVHVKDLTIGEINVTPKTSSEPEASSETTEPFTAPEVPVDLILENAAIDKVTLNGEGEPQIINNFQAQIELLEQQLSIKKIAASYQAFSASTQGKVELTEQFPFSLALDWQGEVPDVGSVAGGGDLSGDLKTINLQHQLTQPAILNTKGDVKLENDEILLNISGDWAQLGWPPNDAPDYVSKQGQYSIVGDVKQLHVTAQTDLSSKLPDIPPLSLKLDTDVTESSLDNLNILLNALEGQTTIGGRVSWSPNPNWDLTVDGEGLDTSKQWPDIPALLNLKTAITGQLKDGVLYVDSHLQQLEGSLQGQPLQGSGHIRVEGNAYSFDKINLQSGPNQLNLDGQLGEVADFVFALDAPELSSLDPRLSGQLKSEGTIKGALDNPEISLTALAQSLQFEQNSLEQADITLNWSSSQADIHINANQPKVPGWEGQSVDLSVTGTPQQHDISLSLADPETKLKANLKGGWFQPNWQGELTRLVGSHPMSGKWQTNKATKLTAGAEQFSLDELCLIQNNAELCSTVNWTPELTRAEGLIKHLPLSLLSAWLPEQTEIVGEVDASYAFNQKGEERNGEVALELDQGSIKTTIENGETGEQENLTLQLSEGKVKANIENETIQSDLALNIGENGSLTGNAKMVQGTSPENTSLASQLQFELPDLKPLQVLLPDNIRLDGRLDGDLEISGTQAEPKVAGKVTLADATTRIPDLGVNFSDINVDVTADSLSNTKIEARMRSGEGELTVSGNVLLDPEKGLPAEFIIKGNDFLVVQLPETVAEISPDLNITFADQLLSARGSVEIPKLDIQIREIPPGSIAVSDDEVILNQPPEEEEETPFNIDADIDLKLGEEVSFIGFGLKTHIQGDLSLTSKEGKSNGQGELSLHEGKYKAYGQDLTMERGKLIFTGPLENPGIDLKATRRSNDDTVTAILNVNGTLRSPSVTISSDPVLPEEQALSYLMSGRSLQEEGPAKGALLRQVALSKGLEKGQALLNGLAPGIGVDSIDIAEGDTLEESSLVLGKYLTPDLYISYGVGLFDAANAFKMRYRLTKRLSVEGTSGSQQSVDLLYKVEKE